MDDTHRIMDAQGTWEHHWQREVCSGLVFSHGNVNHSVSPEQEDNNHFSAELKYSLCFAWFRTRAQN